MILAIEGGDAAGKATQCALLVDRLRDAGIFTTTLSFPDYQSAEGDLLRRVLKGEFPAADPTDAALVVQALQTVGRAARGRELRNAARWPRTGLVLDRYNLGALVYGSLDGLDPSWLSAIHALFPPADLSILIDVSVQESFRRRPDRRDRYERDRGFMGAARDRYLRVFGERPDAFSRSWAVVDGERTVGAVADAIWDAVREVWRRDHGMDISAG